jgi:hypothetical protein
MDLSEVFSSQIKFVRISITNITIVNPTNPMRKYDGFPFSFSGMISLTIV